MIAAKDFLEAYFGDSTELKIEQENFTVTLNNLLDDFAHLLIAGKIDQLENPRTGRSVLIDKDNNQVICILQKKLKI